MSFKKVQSPLGLIFILPIRLLDTMMFAGYHSGSRGRSVLMVFHALVYRSFALLRSIEFSASCSMASTSGLTYRLRLQHETEAPGILVELNRSRRNIGS